jgi:hypothetical protein
MNVDEGQYWCEVTDESLARNSSVLTELHRALPLSSFLIAA